MNLTPEQIEAILNAQSDGASPPEYGLTDDEKDALGEVGNMSMGAAATTMYQILDRMVNITTPRVFVYPSLVTMLEEYRAPYIVVEVVYTKGLSGRSLLLLKDKDAAMITDIMMGGDGNVDMDSFALDEIHLSAISELANQMAGAGATSLAQIFSGPVDIAPPKATLVNLAITDCGLWEDEQGPILKISFDMEIEGLLKSEIMQVLPYEFGKDMISTLLASQGKETAQTPRLSPEFDVSDSVYGESDIADTPSYEDLSYSSPAQPEPAWDEMPPQLPPYRPITPEPFSMPAQEAYHAEPNARSGLSPADTWVAQYQSSTPSPMSNSVHDNLALIVGVPLQVTAELGKTSKSFQEVLDFNIGSVVVLDKLAGEELEIKVNGKLIARGEVVTVEENFGMRITELFSGRN